MAEATDETTTIRDLKQLVELFTSERSWAQFHSPKNLSIAIAVEAAELMDLFKWRTSRGSIGLMRGRTRKNAEEELADILIYCLALANRAKVDVAQAVVRKVARNRRKYPGRKYRGRF